MAIRAPDGANKDKELRWKSPHSLQDLSLCFSSLDWKSFNRQFQIFVFSDESKKELRLPWVALSPNLSKIPWVTLMLLPLPSFLSFCITISPQCKFLWHFLLVQLDRRWLDRLAHTVQVWRKALSRSKGTKVRTAAFYLHRPQEPFVMVSAVMMKRWGLSTVFEVFWLFVNLSQTTPCCCCAAKRFSYHIPVNSICPQIIVRSKVSWVEFPTNDLGVVPDLWSSTAPVLSLHPIR